jgi:hypothetical protein
MSHFMPNPRPVRRLFRDRLDVGVLFVDLDVEAAEEVHRLEVFFAAEFVGQPLAGLA